MPKVVEHDHGELAVCYREIIKKVREPAGGDEQPSEERSNFCWHEGCALVELEEELEGQKTNDENGAGHVFWQCIGTAPMVPK